MKGVAFTIKLFENILKATIIGILFCMVILVFSNVIARYFFHSAITWADKIARFLFIWLTFLGTALALHQGLHIGMDVLTSRLSVRKKNVVEIAGFIFILAFLLVVWLLFSFVVVKVNLGYKAPGSGLPIVLVYFIGPIASFFMIGFSIGHVIHLIKNLKA
ncbi:MAG: TRAP transporter small permease [Spirochaetes bacterium]|nr:TRAP transporter small permease [Spirochaetota bacterium]